MYNNTRYICMKCILIPILVIAVGCTKDPVQNHPIAATQAPGNQTFEESVKCETSGVEQVLSNKDHTSEKIIFESISIENTENTSMESTSIETTDIENVSIENTDTEEQAMIMKINGRIVSVLWEDNASVKELRSLAREGLSIQTSMYGGFEQVGSIGTNIIRADQQMTTSTGDVVLYSGNQLVVFYGSNSWAYTRLGRIDLPEEELKKLLGNDSVVISLEIDS